MYRVNKVLNNNCVLATCLDDKNEVIVMGRGIGFGKKVSERFEGGGEDRVYRLQAESRTDNPIALAKSIDSVVLELTGEILEEAGRCLGQIDRGILLSLADHIAFAVKRLKEGLVITNPLTQEIQIAFSQEYEVAEYAAERIREQLGVMVNEDEKGYIAMHLHTGRSHEKMEDVLGMMQILQECIGIIQEEMQITIRKGSSAYSRLASHVKYMLQRLQSGEKLTLDVNEYILQQMPQMYVLAEKICEMIGHRMQSKMVFEKVPQEEIGYMAMHVQRVCGGNRVN